AASSACRAATSSISVRGPLMPPAISRRPSIRKPICRNCPSGPGRPTPNPPNDGSPMSAFPAGPREGGGRGPVAVAAAAVVLVLAVLFSLGYGPVSIAPGRVLAILLGVADPADIDMPRDMSIINAVRLPRTVLAILVGAATA